jgi:UDP-N-acetylmuramyl pentapeptide phosphotransferase/UDP-N-acetylglucosamine-1-phosphate transferase
VEFLLLVFVTSFFVVLLSMPSLIKVAILKRLFDEPGERKLHTRMIPTIGGIIIFAGTLFSFALWFPTEKLILEMDTSRAAMNDFKFIVVTVLILFFVGVKDDIIGTAPIKKLAAHILVSLILVLMADVRITGLHGLFGVTDIPYWASVFLSMFTIIVIVNAFNLIDGVDGLAAGVGFIASAAYAFWFFYAGDVVMAMLGTSLAGSMLGFLIFNFQPAKIFMGDSGSLTIGVIISVLAIRIVEYTKFELGSDSPLTHFSRPVFAMACLVYPLVDTLRIFIYRAVKGVSPFSADRNHLHHRLIDIGLNHAKTVIVIYIFSFGLIALSVFLQDYDANYALAIVGGAALVLAQIPFFIRKKKKRQVHE